MSVFNSNSFPIYHHKIVGLCFQNVVGWAWSKSVQSQRGILEERTFWKKVDETHAGHQTLEEMAGLFPDG